MKILVTGASGFIGRHLVKRLANAGHEIVCLVRKTSKIGFLKMPNVAFVFGDILGMASINSIFHQIHPDVVFHCAANVRGKNKKKMYMINIEGTRNICEASYSNHVKRLVYLSSVAVVGGNEVPVLTDDLAYKATNTYSKSKIEAERIAIEYRKKGLAVAIIRPCMVYGEGEPHLLDKLFGLIKWGLFPIPDTPSIDSELNLVYVGNVVQALELALWKDEAVSGTFIIADKEIVTFRKVVGIFYSELGKTLAPTIPSYLLKMIFAVPYMRNRINRFFKRRVYDITRAEKLLGYNPTVSTEEGLRQTVRYWIEMKN